MFELRMMVKNIIIHVLVFLIIYNILSVFFCANAISLPQNASPKLRTKRSTEKKNEISTDNYMLIKEVENVYIQMEENYYKIHEFYLAEKYEFKCDEKEIRIIFKTLNFNNETEDIYVFLGHDEYIGNYVLEEASPKSNCQIIKR